MRLIDVVKVATLMQELQKRDSSKGAIAAMYGVVVEKRRSSGARPTLLGPILHRPARVIISTPNNTIPFHAERSSRK